MHVHDYQRQMEDCTKHSSAQRRSSLNSDFPKCAHSLPTTWTLFNLHAGKQWVELRLASPEGTGNFFIHIWHKVQIITYHTRSCWLREHRLSCQSHSSLRKHWLHTRFASKQDQCNSLSSNELYLGVGPYWTALLSQIDSIICFFIKDIFSWFKFGMIPGKKYNFKIFYHPTYICSYFFRIIPKNRVLLKVFSNILVLLKGLKNIETDLLLFGKSLACSVSSLVLNTYLGR